MNPDKLSKPRYNLLPPVALALVVEVLTYGWRRYQDTYGWRKVPQGLDVYTSALMRHLERWRMGEAKDGESGLPHLAHVAVNALVLLDLEVQRIDLLRAREPHPSPTNRGPHPYRSPPEPQEEELDGRPFDVAKGDALDQLGRIFGFSERPKDPLGKLFSDTEFRRVIRESLTMRQG